MEQIPIEQYIQERYKNQMEYYRNASAKNQRNYKRYQWVLIILTAMTPVLTALSTFTAGPSDVPYLKIIIIIISSIVAILTTGLKTFNYHELWVIYRSNYEKLKPEIYYYNFNVGPYSGKNIDKDSIFVARIEAILDLEHKQWPPTKTIKEDQTK